MAEDEVRRKAEDIAVPKANIAEETFQGIGDAAADALPDEPAGSDRVENPIDPRSGVGSSEGAGSAGGRGGHVDWSSGDARPERTPAGPTDGEDRRD
ncbi:hypothetical protein ACNTMW_00825 [Planosporangium sp. 12N6]|uniref:hypothetical protein n=1 Tax=Planosporangium spinosum TaxID=3402278 RepID=UPI003CE70403